MPRSILTITPWKLFAAFLAAVSGSEAIAFATAQYFDWNLEYGPYPTLRYSLIALILLTYPYLVGRTLSRRTGKLYAHRRSMWLLLLAIINNILGVYYTENYGVAWWAVLITLLVNILCVTIVLSLPARLLKSIELNRTVRFNEHWNELFQFMLWPFCVWWLQGRLRNLLTQGGSPVLPQ